ncbi:hypothetical protein WJX73_010124 [Symbiochloris irregularis]|uniref:Peptidase M14 domain-containing protein n=1 Tax=Symbiochloris irregularis TaxID=706552 RepID=A0AAW1P038_9CHLO
MISTNSQFGCGNIEVVRADGAATDTCPETFELRIVPDPYCESDKRAHFMWFYFRVSGVQGQQLRMRIVNAGEASYPRAWNGYQACASYDRKHWFRIAASFDAKTGVLEITHKPLRGAIFVAYFAPYGYEQHVDLIAEMQTHPQVTLHTLGQTVDGHDLDLLRIGEPAPGRPNIWIVARQHPGESMAEWFAEGLLRRLIDRHDALARRLQQTACFWVVPNMNPDGSWRGHLRVNAAGANLNREWQEPSMERSPEVFLVRELMDRVGVDFFADIHGDEELPYNFISGCEGIPSWSPKLESLLMTFSEAFKRASPDFQTVHGYGRTPPGRANLKIAGSQIGERFKCLSFTLEMPFKDTIDVPDPAQGWCPERALRFGATFLQPLSEVLQQLR